MKDIVMTDIDTLSFWKEKLDDEIFAREKSDSKEYQNERGYLLYQILNLHKRYNELLDKEIKTKWFCWYRYNLAKRCLRIFKVKNIYRSPKAKAYWNKYYMTKKCKTVSDKYLKHPQISEFISLVYQIKNKDKVNQDIWNYVIKYLNDYEVGAR